MYTLLHVWDAAAYEKTLKIQFSARLLQRHDNCIEMGKKNNTIIIDRIR